MRLRQGTRNETKSNHVDNRIFEPTSTNFALRAKLVQSDVLYCSKSPFLEEFFLDNAFKIVPNRLKKGLKKKCRQTEKIWPDLEVAGTRFWTSETALLLQVASKSGSKTNSQILLTTRLKSTSGFFVRCTLLNLRLRRNNFKMYNVCSK